MPKQVSDEQRAHQQQLIYYFAARHKAKYEAGAIEHGGGLWELSDDQLIEMAIEEVLDLCSYLVTLVQNRKQRGD